MRIPICLFCLAITASTAHAQKLSLYLGGNAGFPITRNLPGTAPFGPSAVTPQGPRLTAGPAFTMLVDNRLAVDVEALFRPIRYQTRTDSPRVTSFDTIHGTALEIPVIVSYHFLVRSAVSPFAGAGLIPYEKSWGRDDAHSIIHDQGDRETNVVFSFPGFNSESKPLLLRAGVSFGRTRWLIRPEIRYTHSSGSSGRTPNQWDAFVNVAYRWLEHETSKAGP